MIQHLVAWMRVNKTRIWSGCSIPVHAAAMKEWRRATQLHSPLLYLDGPRKLGSMVSQWGIGV